MSWVGVVIVGLLGGLLGAMAGGAAQAAQDVQAAQDDRRGAGDEMKVTHVSGPIYVLEGRGGNVGVSHGEDGILIVDDQFTYSYRGIVSALEGLGGGKLHFVLNTHHHFDHTGSNAFFGQKAHIVAHEKVRQRLAMAANHKPEALPVVTFEDALSIHFNGEEIKMIHFPQGHTDNDSVVLFTRSNVVHMGDLFFSNSYPSIYPQQGGDPVGYARNVGSMIEQLDDDVKVIPGHGPLATLAELRDFHAMLTETLAMVEARVAAGKSLEEAQAAGLPRTYDRWASPFTSHRQWIALLYRGLADR